MKRKLALWLAVVLMFTTPAAVFAEEIADVEAVSVAAELTDAGEEKPAAEVPEVMTDAPADIPVTEEPAVQEGTTEAANESQIVPVVEDQPAEEMEEAEEALVEEELEQGPEPSVSYRTHVQGIGWQSPVIDGAMSGTQGQSKRLEGIEINVQGADDLGVRYMTHVQTYGWETAWKENGAMSGTSGQSKRLEAIRIELTGTDAQYFDIWYCVHAQNYGWLAWAKNGEEAGTAGYGYRLEGIKIEIRPKNSAAPVREGTQSAAYYSRNDGPSVDAYLSGVVYNTHVQTYGWQDYVGNGTLSGTSGESKRLEGIHIRLANQYYAGGVEYRTHVQGIGWQEWKSNGEMSGTSGQAKRLEGIEIRLTGEISDHFDIYYQVHAQTFGWLGWAKNGQMAGTSGLSKRLEAIKIVLIPKGLAAPGPTTRPNVTAATAPVVVQAQSPAYTPAATPTAFTYIGNRNSKIFHKSTCESVSNMKEKNKVALSTREEAISLGYTPCQNCNP